MKRILITGGAGFLGSHIAERHLDRGDSVSCLDVVSDQNEHKIGHLLERPGFTLYRGSVLDKDIMDKLIWECDLCYHFAAVVGVDHYVTNPCEVINVNVNGTQLVFDLALKYGRKVVFASTSEVYGRSTDVPFREDGDRVLGPTSIDRWSYSTSKAIGEHYAFALAKKGLRVVALRFFNAYGPRLDSLESGRVLSIFIGQLLAGKPLTVVGSGEQIRCFTYVDDVVDGIIASGQVPEAEGEVINIGRDAETSIKSLAELLIRLHGKGEIEYINEEEMYGLSYEDIPRRVPDISKARRILEYSPKIDDEEGVRRTLEWFVSHRDSLPSVDAVLSYDRMRSPGKNVSGFQAKRAG